MDFSLFFPFYASLAKQCYERGGILMPPQIITSLKLMNKTVFLVFEAKYLKAKNINTLLLVKNSVLVEEGKEDIVLKIIAIKYILKCN